MMAAVQMAVAEEPHHWDVPSVKSQFAKSYAKSQYAKSVCVCVDLLTGGESLCHDGVSTHGPVLSPHLEAALTKSKVLPQ